MKRVNSIRKKRLVAASCWAAVFHLFFLNGFAGGAATPPKLNILFFTAADMNFDSSDAYGGPIENLAPRIDRLAAEGLRFQYAYSTVAVTLSPARLEGPRLFVRMPVSK